jgi:hypothetical protein
MDAATCMLLTVVIGRTPPAGQSLEVLPLSFPTNGGIESEPQLNTGVEALRERARVLESQRASLMQLTLELQALVSSLNGRLRTSEHDADSETISRRMYVAHFGNVQVRTLPYILRLLSSSRQPQRSPPLHRHRLRRAAQDLVARLIVQSQQAFFQAQTRSSFQARAPSVDMFTVINAEAQFKRKLKQTVRELNEEAARAAELRTSLGDVRVPLRSSLHSPYQHLGPSTPRLYPLMPSIPSRPSPVPPRSPQFLCAPFFPCAYHTTEPSPLTC